MYNPLLYLASQGDNYFITPGESVSMLGQIPLYIPSDKNIVFKPSSMNEAHESIFRLAAERRYISYFTGNGEVILSSEPKVRKNDDSQKFINDILERFNNPEKEQVMAHHLG